MSEHDQTTIQVRAAAKGDTAGLSWVIERFSPALVASADRRLSPALKRHIDAEDLVQELWLAVMPKLGQISPRNGRLTPVLLTYLTTSLVRRIGALARRQATRGDHEVPLLEDHDASEETLSIVSLAVRGETQARVRTSLDELSEGDRSIIVLRAFEQMPNEQVATTLGITPNAAAVRYHRALSRLKSRLPGTLMDDLELSPHGS